MREEGPHHDVLLWIQRAWLQIKYCVRERIAAQTLLNLRIMWQCASRGKCKTEFLHKR